MSQQQLDTDLFKTWTTQKLRLLFLIPMVLAFLATISLLMGILLNEANKGISHKLAEVNMASKSLYHEGVRYNTSALKTIMHTLKQDPEIYRLLKGRDRQAILNHAVPLFKKFKQDFSITHFYFIGKDRVCLARAHTPECHSDIIHRNTLLQAEASGKVAHGIELGRLGTFTLRLVSPIFDQNKQLLGYIEIGLEIDQLLEKIHNYFGAQVLPLIKKEFLDRSEWQSGMKTLGRNAQWNTYQDYVSNDLYNEQQTEIVKVFLNDKLAFNKQHIFDGKPYKAISLPITDAVNREIAEMILIIDVSVFKNRAKRLALWGLFTAIFIGSILLILFNWLITKIGSRLEQDQHDMQIMASHDELTELYNRRMFYKLFSDEMIKLKKSKQPLSILMIDIDFFKKINDQYGHNAGDIVLHDLSQLIVEELRQADKVFRYGGEELSVILPDTDKDKAYEVAECLREKVDVCPFKTDGDINIHVTISIGVTTVEVKNSSTELKNLMKIVDQALYDSKNNGRNRVTVR